MKFNFSEKIIAKIKSIKWDRNQLILAVLALIILLIIDLYFLAFLMGQSTKLKPRISKLKQDISTLNKNLVLVRDSKCVNIPAQESAAMSKKFIHEGEVALLLQRVSEMAAKETVKIMQISSLKEQENRQSSAKELFAGKLAPVSIVMELSGDYHHLGKFISNLENADFFVMVQQLRITPSPNSYVLQSITLTLKTYVTK